MSDLHNAPFPVLTAIGFAGSLAMVLSSYWVGCTPDYFLFRPPTVVSLLHHDALLMVVAFWVGLGMQVVAWLLMGHQLVEGTRTTTRQVRNAAILWAAPFTLAMPLASRDVWAYADQGHIAALGLNPYTVTPLQLPGPFTDNVTPRWQDVASPYGPLWTWLNRGVSELGASHLVLTVGLLRLLCLVGFGLLVVCLPALAERLGGRGTVAIWAVLANPLTVLHLVGGAHNDLLMIGLLALALYVATGPGTSWLVLLAAGALTGLAAAVKFPAIIAVPFSPLLWAHTRSTAEPARTWFRLRSQVPLLARGLGFAVLGAVVATAATTGLAGYGLSWLDNVNSGGHGSGVIGVAIMLAALTAAWVLALRWPPAPMLAVAFAAVVLITPAALPWYWTWVFVVAGCVVTARGSILLLAGWTITLLIAVNPSGRATHLRGDLSLAVAALIIWALLDQRWHPFAAYRRSAEQAEPRQV